MKLEYIDSKYTTSKGIHYQLRKIRPVAPIKDRFYSIGMDGLVIIQPGYAWDGPSGPTLDTKDVMFCSLIHDVLYEAMRKEQLSLDWRDEADEELAEIGKACGASSLRMEAWEWAVGNFAEDSALPENRKKVHKVPAVTELD